MSIQVSVDARAAAAGATPALSAGFTRYALAVLTLVNLVYYVDRSILLILIEPVRTSFGLSDGSMGLIIGAAFAVAYSVTSVPAGWIGDRVNRVHFLSACLGVWCLSTAAFGAVSSYMQMLIARIGVASGEAGGFVTTQALVSDLFKPQRRASAMGILFFGGMLGTVLAYALGGWLNDLIGWRQTFIVVGLAGMLLLPLLLWTVPHPPRGATDDVRVVVDNDRLSLRQALAILLSRRALVLVMIGYTFACVGVYGLNGWFPTYLVRRFDLSLGQAGSYASLALIAPMMVGMLAGGFLGDILFKRDPRWAIRLPALGLMAAYPVLLVQIYAPSLPSTLGAALLPSFVAGVYTPPLLAGVQMLTGARLRATGVAVASFMLMLVGQGGGPWLIGLISDKLARSPGATAYSSLQHAMALTMVFYLIGGLVLLFASRLFLADAASARRFDEGLPGRRES